MPHSQNPTLDATGMVRQQTLLNQNSRFAQCRIPVVCYSTVDQSHLPLMEENIAPTSLNRTSTHSSSSTFSSSGIYAYKICLDQPHQTLACPSSSCEALTNSAAIRAENINNNGHRPGNNSNRRLNNHQHQSLSFGAKTQNFAVRP